MDSSSTTLKSNLTGDTVVQGNNERARSAGGPEWEQKSLLSLDGGGIRGLWSLLVLERLMEYIAREEEGYSDDGRGTRSSFEPLPYPPNVSQVRTRGLQPDDRRTPRNRWRNPVPCLSRSRSADPAIETSKALPLKLHTTDARDNFLPVLEASNPMPLEPYQTEKSSGLLPAQRYLPCHYFDLICGSSTGALIAIMLGRLRMTVTDCIQEYKALGNEVFGSPRVFSARYFLIGDRHLYDSAKFEAVIKDVIHRRCEKYEGLRPETLLKSDGDLCRIALTALETGPDNPELRRTFLFRSYTPRHTRMGGYDADARIRPRGRTFSNFDPETRRKGTSQTLVDEKRGQLERERTVGEVPLWLAAKAATAADLFFKPVEIPSRQGKMVFRDGGFGSNNNPCWLGVQELRDEFGRATVGSVVSVGTARQNKFLSPKGPFKFITNTVSGWVDDMTDPTPNHLRLLEASHDDGFFYQRLNSDHKNIPEAMLTVALDEWDPRKHWWSSQQPGADTLRLIQSSFERWAASKEADARLKSCAKQLVVIRRKRCTNVARWERFACGVKYTCPCREDHCSWIDKDKYVKHLVEFHGFSSNEVLVALEVRSERWEYQPG